MPMPLNGSDVASRVSGAAAVANTVAESAKYNSEFDDVYAILNTVRSIAKGYTGASTAIGAANSLEVVSFGDAQTISAADQAQARANISAALKGHIRGLTLSNSVGDATNDIDIASGEAASTETNPVLMVLASALTKRLDASWAVGTGNGGLDTGSIADGTYHVWLIQRSDTGVVDVLFSTSASSPTMPANYDRKRRIGSFIRVSSTIRPFVQDGDDFWYLVPYASGPYANAGSSAVDRTLVSPAGLRLKVHVAFSVTSGSGNNYIAITDKNLTAFNASNDPYDGVGNATTFIGRGLKSLYTDTSSGVAVRQSGTHASDSYTLWTRGWEDRRGRLS
jgi:hypothetical protein